MITLYKHEWKTYFITSIGYIFLAVFLALSGFIFVVNNLISRTSDLRGFFFMSSYVWLLESPVPVMRLMAGERRRGTDRILHASPVSVTQALVAKYLAALSLSLLALVLSLIFPLVVQIYGGVHWPEVWMGYIGLFGYFAAHLALNLLVSSFAQSPAAAFTLSLGANFLLRLFAGLSAQGTSLINRIASLVDFDSRLTPFIYGQWSPASFVYFLCFAVLCVSLTVLLLGLSRRRRA
ncbi:MAG: ABC transporter permease [Christensenellales bacterium]|jgi:ABC-2 type transport system permease protein|nr:ABC transporter permease subunit [Clostridiales bacterium]